MNPGLGAITHFIRFAHGIAVMRFLAWKHRALLSELRPLATTLEREISPRRIARGETTNGLVVTDDGLRLNDSDEESAHVADCPKLRAALKAVGISRVTLDALLEEGQVAEAFLLLLHAKPHLPRAEADKTAYNGWRSPRVARNMVSEEGFHRFCFVLKVDLDGHHFQAAYSYCELPLSLYVQRYVQKHAYHGDHRVLFQAAPRVGLVALALVALPAVLHLWFPTLAIAIYFLLGLFAALLAAVTVYTLGSIQYTREHHDTMLQRQVDEIAEAYRLLDAEFAIIGTIQRSLLPRETPDVPGLEIATHYETCQRAGGDYYDFFPLRNGNLGVLIADVSGHGSPAAVLMAITHTIAHIVHEKSMETAPEEVMAYINRNLARHHEYRGDFVTAIYGVYDPKERTFQYAAAGHNPPMMCRDGKGARMLEKQQGLPLGVMEDAVYESASVPIAAGETLLLYTDGITEAMDGKQRLFGEERTAAVLGNGECAKEQVKALLAAVCTHVGKEPLNDDRTVVLLRGC